MALQWHDISDPSHRTLDDLAADYQLHPLHIEDARNGAQRTKAEDDRGRYLFLIFKLPSLEGDQRLKTADLSLFVGREFLITVHHGPASPLEGLQKS
jgi:magnesium transporter